MIEDIAIGLAAPGDAAAIALLSRDTIEAGLRWRWTPERVRRAIADPSTNVIAARDAAGLAGFALLQYGDEEAHLLLLGVQPRQRRRGIARAMLAWLESTLRTAGITRVRAEVRLGNAEARAFYGAMGFEEVGQASRYYAGIEHAALLRWNLPLAVK